jgi:hypothetical protein
MVNCSDIEGEKAPYSKDEYLENIRKLTIETFPQFENQETIFLNKTDVSRIVSLITERLTCKEEPFENLTEHSRNLISDKMSSFVDQELMTFGSQVKFYFK